MELSEPERRRLAQIEQGLIEDDPALATRFVARNDVMGLVRTGRRRLIVLATCALVSALGLVVGLAVTGDGAVGVLVVTGVLCALGSFGGMLAVLTVQPAGRGHEKR